MKKTDTIKHRLYYYLFLLAIVVIIIANCLLFTSLLVFSERFELLQRKIVEKLSFKLVERHTLLRSYATIDNRAKVEIIKTSDKNANSNNEQFTYSNKYKLWTVTANKHHHNNISQLTSFDIRTLLNQTDERNHLHQSEFVNSELTIWPKVFSSLSSNKDVHNRPVVSYDRVIEQLICQPDWLSTDRIDSKRGYDLHKIAKIVPSDDLEPNQKVFLQQGCSVNKCEITYDWSEADAIIFTKYGFDFVPEGYNRTKEQIWIAYMLESPSNLFRSKYYEEGQEIHYFNWTATYRHDSDIVTPYEKFVPFTETMDQYYSLGNLSYDDKKYYYDKATSDYKRLIRDKRKNLVWFVSNCHTVSSREQYVKSLSAYIDIDVYGRCGDKTCDRSNHGKCLQMASTKYKFYIAFENSKHTDYITEKFFVNGLGKNDLNHLLVPVVMGTSKADYLRQAPTNSFIHVDDFEGPMQLAGFLNTIGSDEVLYHSYFIWKSMGKFIDTKFYCRVCAMIHHAQKRNLNKYYDNIYEWFSKKEANSKIYTNQEYDNSFRNY